MNEHQQQGCCGYNGEQTKKVEPAVRHREAVYQRGAFVLYAVSIEERVQTYGSIDLTALVTSYDRAPTIRVSPVRTRQRAKLCAAISTTQ